MKMLFFYVHLREGNGDPNQYSCLENPMDGGPWWTAVHGVPKKLDTTERLHFHFSLSCIGEGTGNALQCSWGIPGMGEPGGLPSMGSHRVRHDWSNLAASCSCYLLFNDHREKKMPIVVVVKWLGRVWLFVTPWTAACQASPSFTISQNLLKLTSVESVMPSNHLILCHPLLLPASIFRA